MNHFKYSKMEAYFTDRLKIKNQMVMEFFYGKMVNHTLDNGWMHKNMELDNGRDYRVTIILANGWMVNRMDWGNTNGMVMYILGNGKTQLKMDMALRNLKMEICI